MGRRSVGEGDYVKNNIRVLREKAGLTATELSRLSGISKGQISKLELSRRRVSLDVADKLAKFLNSTRTEVAGDHANGMMTVTVDTILQAGVWSEGLERLIEAVYDVTVLESKRYPGIERHASEVRGHGMDRLLPDGSVAIWVKMESIGEPLFPGCQYVVSRKNDKNEFEQAARSFLKDSRGEEFFFSESSDPAMQETMRSDSKAITVIGRIVTAIREM